MSARRRSPRPPQVAAPGGDVAGPVLAAPALVTRYAIRNVDKFAHLWVQFIHIHGTIGSQWTESTAERLELESRILTLALAKLLGGRLVRIRRAKLKISEPDPQIAKGAQRPKRRRL